MIQFSDQSYYQILEVSPWASRSEIQRSYEILRATFDDGSIASYSLFSETELADIRLKIGEAYRVLSDDGLRRSYDATLPAESWAGKGVRNESALESREHVATKSQDIGNAAIALEEAGYSGPAIREYREALGISLDDIHVATRINLPYLRAIEEEEDGVLPHEVYLKAYLVQFARRLGLNPVSVVKGYMAHRRYRQAGHARPPETG